MGFGFGARALGWDSTGAEVEMPGRVGETMGGGRERELGTWFGEVFCCFLMLAAPKILVSVWR